MLLFFCLTALTLAAGMLYTPPVALAAGGQLTLSGQTSGHSGTAFHIDGSRLAPDGSYSLYATMDAARCTVGDPGTLGLQPFTPATISVSGSVVSHNLTWPADINQSGSYYLCLVNTSALSGQKTVSSNTFTLAAAATLDVSPHSVMAGQNITLSGTNWLPAQQLDVAVVTGSNAETTLAENTNVMPDATGNFTIKLVIPDTATPRQYSIRAYAVNDQTLMVVKNNSLTVTQQPTPAPTPTPTIQPSPTPTPTIQPSPTPTSALTPGDSATTPPTQNNDMDGNNLNLLIFGMAGLGVLFVLIGAVIFAVSMQVENE